MCAVQVQGARLAGETRRRRTGLQLFGGQRLSVLVLLLGIWSRGACADGANDAAGLPTPWPDTTFDDCHSEYVLAFEHASSSYTIAYEQCEVTANETQIDLNVEEELERAQIEEGRSTICAHFTMCNSIDNDLEYLECVKDHSTRNLDLITKINHNATSASTRLREDYDDVKKTLVLCSLDAQVVYIESMRQAHEELLLCRKEAGEVSEN